MFKKHLPLLFVLAASLGTHQTVLAQQSSAPGVQKRLSDFFSTVREDELIEPEQAFRIQVAFKGATTLVAELIPAKGYYLYRDRIKFSVENADGVAIKSIKLPPGKVTNDPTFGKTETYEQPVQAELTLERSSKSKDFTLTASYQGCHKKTGVCYPPMNTRLNLALP